MKIFIVNREYGKVGWDEYDSLVVVAKNAEKAMKIAIEHSNYFSEEGATIEELPMSEEKVVHESFNAG